MASIDMISLGGSPEIQQLIVRDRTNTIAPAFKYKLAFNGVTTANCIAYDATASALEAALNGLSTIGAAGVMVSRDVSLTLAPNGYIYGVTFIGDITSGNPPLISVVRNDAACEPVAVPTTEVLVTELSAGGRHPQQFALSSAYAGERPGSHVAYHVAPQFRVLNEQIDVQKIVVTNSQNDISACKWTVHTVAAWSHDNSHQMGRE
ncbi:hypothetical protein PINS_up005111 [Pythium insidiosum]|nr:hypothetical protein PINS_up005111 [Pythium insidiosum]